MHPIVKYSVYGVVGLVALSVAAGSFYNIDEGERGVVLRFSAFQKVAEPGLGFKIPFIDSVRRISIREHIVRYGSAEAPQTDLQTYSFDNQLAGIRISINYTVPPGKVEELYRRYKSIETMTATLFDARIMKATKEVFGQYTASKAIQGRTQLGIDINTKLQALVEGEPIIVNGVQFENVDFSEAYETSVENRMLAEIEVQKIQQNALSEKVKAEITVIQAQATADAVVAAAKADAEARTLRGEAEASAIRAKGLALAENPALVALVSAEKWDGALPGTMVPNGAVPFVDVATKGELPAKPIVLE